MKKIFVLQITMIILFSSAGIGLLTYTDVYDSIKRKIVEELCLSCIKLGPDTDIEYRFETANNMPHPDFVLENLSKGPVVITYRIDFCPGCDELEEVLIDVLNISFGPYDVFYKKVKFNNSNITFIHINTNRVKEDSLLYKSRYIYDIVGDAGNPMMVFVTYGYNHGFIEPTYATIYGLKEKPKNQKEELRNYIKEAIDLYNTHKEAVD